MVLGILLLFTNKQNRNKRKFHISTILRLLKLPLFSCCKPTISCCNLPFKSDVPKTVIWLGDVTTIGGLKYGEWKALSSVFYYSCCISATLNKETIQTYCYTGIYTCCLNFILQCIICPPLTIPWNYWNGSLLLTSLK